MNASTTHDVLNRLLTIEERSLPQYLTYARPWEGDADHTTLDTLDQIVADQKALAERISAFILDGGGMPQNGEFPMQFTDLHDLSLDYILRVAVARQQQDVAAIAPCVDALRLAPAAKELAEEALGMAKGHLERLEEFASRPVSG